MDLSFSAWSSDFSVGQSVFTTLPDPQYLRGTVSGLTPGLHGFHVHETGDLGNGCLASGPHYNPTNVVHGGPMDTVRHVGDLGNINTPDNGSASLAGTNVVFKQYY
ncbi:copper/zinc superoxide dismutase [Ancylostoma ceylanicum]|uniref:Copper/zinc superoxide dismutase n=1 Tax=Ancylostoma ceylanicum TaxID=53326 RepID=A0A0D6LRT5_9BILA|nr:copper/zinc superoxide dismutase [Ancylostoma ceylanicum]